MMTGAKLSNARDSTRFRSERDLRINLKEGQKNRPKRLPPGHHAYGLPLRQSSPMREVIGNYYGEMAEGEMQYKYDSMRQTRSQFRSTARDNMRTTKHTQKSAVAADYVARKGIDNAKKTELMTGGENLFKMKKFQTVAPRTNTHNRRRPQTSKA